MKYIYLLCLLPFLMFSCKKKETDPASTFTVRYYVNGSDVSEYKFTKDGQTYDHKTPFTGSMDTTFTETGGFKLTLLSKASGTGPALTGRIYVDGVIMAEKTDIVKDATTGGYDIELEYQLPSY